MSGLGSYIAFLIRSTNQHGVHSPFVYHFLTQCMYRRYPGRFARTQKIILKSILYFNYNSVGLLSTGQELWEVIKAEYEGISFDNPPYDLYIVGRGQLARFDFDSLYNQYHNDSMILIEGIRKTDTDLERWNDLRADPRISVSIDYYFGGILFLRKEQEKQHFRIRI